ncbi:MAG: WecB/TagA/CpsF family glycosyltransferase [Planctomycetaceae bacterium]|nr:WecB/TagA/CpsF family glycosyltransferase [Planctomycetales bacterium]MCB9923796.1 WecB/TagA/CpsF family glycosyltransferase [Planctomycetaceae bacterium]
MIDRGRHNVLGIMVNAVDYDAAVQRIVDAARAKQPLAVSALAVHGIMTGVLDREHRYRLNELDLIVPDGQPVRWALNRLHSARLRDRVYGPNLMLKTCERAAEEGLPVFLFGGNEELLSALRTKLAEQFPKLQFAGCQASKFRQFTPEERDQTIDAIRQSGAAITMVGLGCPRQEVWAYEFREALSMPLLAVGAAFNFHAGLLPQAPQIMQDWGFEWLFRLVAEPRRLWQRYLVLNPLYASMLCLQALRLRSFDPNDARRPDHEILYG